MYSIAPAGKEIIKAGAQIRAENIDTAGRVEQAENAKRIATRVEDLMTEFWRMIFEIRYLFGEPAEGWKKSDQEAYLDLFPREHDRWAYNRPIRRKLAVLVDGTPCDVVTASHRRIARARALLDEVRSLTRSDRVTVRPEFANICGAFPNLAEGSASEGSVAHADRMLREEQRRLDTLSAQAANLFHQAQEEYDRQRSKRIPFFRDYRRARFLAALAVERGEWLAKPILEWTRSDR